MTAGLAAARATGARMEDPHYLGLLADGYLQDGDGAAALVALGEALVLVRRERSVFYEPELHRLRAAALAATGAGSDQVGEALRRAATAARRHGSRPLELRALVELARGGDTQARRGAAALLESFDEGFDTPDLRAASALLAAPTAR
jgi:predicted ATPase